MSYEIVTLKQKPHLSDQIDRLGKQAWPEFIHHSNIRHWHALFDTFAHFQLLLCEPGDTVIGIGHTVPIVWNGTNEDLPDDIDTIIVRAMEAHQNQRAPTTLSAMAAIVAKSHRGQGLSSVIARAMCSLAAEYGLSALIAPVRPTMKSLYPLTPFDRYIQWQRDDGAPFDPWIRVHWRLGAEQLQVIPKGLVVTGRVAEWEEWTSMRFPESGVYVVPDALQPVTIDHEQNIGRYEDPNIWMRHPT